MSAKDTTAIVSAKPIVPALPPEWARLEQVASECSLATLGDVPGKFTRMLAIARGLDELRQAITPQMMRDVLSLAGTSLGFRTDKDGRGGYNTDVIKDCFIEATLRGFAPVGNEFNIIAGRFYGTREGFSARLREFPGLTDLKIIPGIPKNVGESGAIVKVNATWKVNGRAQSLEREFAIRVNQGMGADAIIGKADRKMKAAIYSMLTGSEMSDGDASEMIDSTATSEPVASVQTVVPPPAAPETKVPRTDALAEKLGAKTSDKEPEPEAQAESEPEQDAGGEAPRKELAALPYPWPRDEVVAWVLGGTLPEGMTQEEAKKKAVFILDKRVVVGKAWDAISKEGQRKAYVEWMTDGFPWHNAA